MDSPAPDNPTLIYCILELHLTFPVLESLFKAFLISKIIHHPFSHVKRKDCKLVTLLDLEWMDVDEPSYTLEDKTIYVEDSVLVKDWRPVPRLGDMFLFSGEVGLWWKGSIITFIVHDTPIPLPGYGPIWIKTNVINISYINLRFDLRQELLNWATEHDL